MKVSREVIILGGSVLALLHLALYVLAEIFAPALLILLGSTVTRVTQVVVTSVVLAGGGGVLAQLVNLRDGGGASVALHLLLSETVVAGVGVLVAIFLQARILMSFLNMLYCESCVLAGGMIVYLALRARRRRH